MGRQCIAITGLLATIVFCAYMTSRLQTADAPADAKTAINPAAIGAP
jgi:hypothetical protein